MEIVKERRWVPGVCVARFYLFVGLELECLTPFSDPRSGVDWDRKPGEVSLQSNITHVDTAVYKL